MIKKTTRAAENWESSKEALLAGKDREFLGRPFHFPGTNGKAVLLVHGWTDVPYEVRRLGMYLNEKGYSVLGPVLRGHGTSPEDLQNIKWEDWLYDVEKAYQELKKEHRKIYVIGTSIGSNLAVMLAKDKPEVSGIVLMAMPYAIRQEKIALFLVRVANLFVSYLNKYYPPTFRKSENITRRISYQRYPLRSVLEVFELVKTARKELPKIHQPCFVMQSNWDHVVARKSLENIFSRISSDVKRKKYINKAYHTFISDIQNEHVFKEILDFFEEN